MQASDDLISAEYQATLQKMHKEQPQWGNSGLRFIDQINTLIDRLSVKTILDYGCGKGGLAKQLERMTSTVKVSLYDPGIPEHATPYHGTSFNLVICTDVLEHIEREKVDNVLANIAALSDRAAYFIVHTGLCGHTLPDGRPAHITREPIEWWKEKIARHFTGFNVDVIKTNLPYRYQIEVVLNDN